MKKIFSNPIMLFLMMIVALLCFTGLANAQVYDIYNGLTYTDAFVPATIAASDTSETFDLSAYNGKVVIVQSVPYISGSSETLDGKLQESSDQSTWTGTSDSAFTQVTAAGATQKKFIDPRKNKRYIRWVGTLSASDTAGVGVMFIGQKRYR